MKKTIYLGAITLVIAGLLTVVSAGAMVRTSQSPQTPTVIVKTGNEITGRNVAMAKSLEPIRRNSPVSRSAVVVATGAHPAVSSDNNGNVVVGFEAQDNVWYCPSIDYGATFNAQAVGWQFNNPPSLPSVDSCGGGRFIATLVPNYQDDDGGDVQQFTTSNPNDIQNGWTGVYWKGTDLGDGYYDYQSVACGGYTKGDPNEDAWAYGGISMIGTYNHSDPVVGTPFFFYQFDNTGYGWFYPMNTTKSGGTSTSMVIDPVTLHGFVCWNYNNSGNMDIYAYENNFSNWSEYQGYPIHPDIKEAEIYSAGNDAYVDIAAFNDNVIIVSQRDGNIVAYYSADALTTVDEVTIQTGAVNPRVMYNSEHKATCSFVKDGQVYFSTTDDDGATWSIPKAIDEPENQNVPAEFQSADISGLGAVWQQVDGNVYFASTTGALPPVLDITGITGGIKVGATISNTGGADATNVIWTIKIIGGIFKRINKTYTDTIVSLPVDSPQKITTTGFVLGWGKITIAISATCQEGASKQVSTTGKLLLIYIKI
ncbi:MAG TPA: hypothetical protein VMT57_07490 [Candidatus Thermoplasmatota archaeon]|nr:hypothetical protein [Candidatus Thermoplasmatota archaeon]